MADHEGVYGNYYYIVDGKLTKLERDVVRRMRRLRVLDMKRVMGAELVHLCDMVKRGLRPAVRR